MSRLQLRGNPEPRFNFREFERQLAQSAAADSTLRSDVNDLITRMEEQEFEQDTSPR